MFLANGASCGGAAPCESSRCEASVIDGQSVCCSLDCAVSERCSADGSSCVPLPREAGQACTPELPCAGGLSCAAAGANQFACCAVACTEGQFCVDLGARCATPGQADGAECVLSGQCVSGYCELDRKVCTPNPCVGKAAGSYCASGAQCDAAGLCSFTGMGLVAAGAAHTCAVTLTGVVRCWGGNQAGALGLPVVAEETDIFGDTLDEIPRNFPDVTFEGRRALQVAAGGGHSCALLEDGNVRCWGENTADQLTSARADGDVFLPTGQTAVQIDAGGAHACAVLSSGQVTCWGNNGLGQLGYGHTDVLPNVELPTVTLPERALQVTAGNGQTCAVLESGALHCWGTSRDGVLGYGSAGAGLTTSESVDVGAPVLSASTGSSATCVVVSGGFVRCWGNNDGGILGYGHDQSIGLTETPAQAASLLAANGNALGGDVPLGGGGVVQVEVDTGTGHVCARFSGGAVRCWGGNSDGALGYGHIEDIGDDETPAQAAQLRPDQLGGDVPFGQSVLALATGSRCAVLDEREVICWGPNGNGELGLPRLFPNGTPDVTPADMLLTRVAPLQLED
jgi:alpha-tubulin suppressor-like RCC1 family protein